MSDDTRAKTDADAQFEADLKAGRLPYTPDPEGRAVEGAFVVTAAAVIIITVAIVCIAIGAMWARHIFGG